MKKPKFDQLRGTYAHALRHRICLGVTVCVMSIGFIGEYGLTKISPEPGKKFSNSKLVNRLFKVDPRKKNFMHGVEFDSSTYD